MPGAGEEIVVSESGYRLPVADLLTGRGAIFGKSGSGKSNTMTVVVEELLDLGLPLLIVDQDGEYHGLKEEYDVLHAGAGTDYDLTVGADDGEHVADRALEDNDPVVLDVSGFMEEEPARELVYNVVRRLFVRENEVQKPFLLVVEEVHEYVPEKGGHDELGEMLVRVAKRGRKRGLGLCGVSQRPASVDKDFITQCDWIVWHRLTWNNDTRVVGRILGSDYADRVQDLSDGEAYVMTDWSEDVRRVNFRLKRTRDAGATPGLEQFGMSSSSSGSDRESVDDGSGGRSGVADGRSSIDDGGSSMAGHQVGPAGGSSSPGAGTNPPAADGSARSVGADSDESAPQDTVVDDAIPAADVDPDDVAPRSGPPPGVVTDEDVYDGNPVWELGQMFAFVFGTVLFRIANLVRRLLPRIKPWQNRPDPLGGPGADAIDWKLTSLLMVVLNLLLLVILAFVYLFVLG